MKWDLNCMHAIQFWFQFNIEIIKNHFLNDNLQIKRNIFSLTRKLNFFSSFFISNFRVLLRKSYKWIFECAINSSLSILATMQSENAKLDWWRMSSWSLHTKTPHGKRAHARRARLCCVFIHPFTPTHKTNQIDDLWSNIRTTALRRLLRLVRVG